MQEILVIGCGNIGAQYDRNNTHVLTHVKAWSLKSGINLTVFDLNKKLMHETASLYNCSSLDEITLKSLSSYDIVSLCTPTNTHFHYLEKLIQSNVKTVICEKPISYSIDEINNIKRAYDFGRTKILVNYIRRFQTDYIKLKIIIEKIIEKEKITNISIKYQRGFINNCSHALDLLEFLFDKPLELDNMKFHNIQYDQFKLDPTLSLSAFWNKVNINILGLSNVLFSFFEIDIVFKTQKISITEAGDKISFYKSKKYLNHYGPLLYINTINDGSSISNYMIPVVNQALKITKNPNLSDNFLQSADLNIKILNYLKSNNEISN